MILIMVIVGIGFGIYGYMKQNKEENRVEYLENLADKFHENIYLDTYLNMFEKIYQKTKDDTIVLYKTNKAIQLENDKLKSQEYIILQDMGDKYKVYSELQERVTQKKNIKNADIKKIADFDSYPEVKESYNRMIKEIESLRKVNNLPYSFNNVFVMLNLMQGHDVEYDGTKPVVEKSLYDEIADFLEESWGILKWVLIVLFFSAILNIVTGEKVLGFNGDTKKRDPKKTPNDIFEDNTEPKMTPKVVPKEKSVQTKVKTKQTQEEKEVGEVNLDVSGLTNFRDRQKKIVLKDGKYICDVDVWSSSLKADSFDGIVKLIENYYLSQAVEFSIVNYER